MSALVKIKIQFGQYSVWDLWLTFRQTFVYNRVIGKHYMLGRRIDLTTVTKHPRQTIRPGSKKSGTSRKVGIGIGLLVLLFVFFAVTWSTEWMQRFDDSVGDAIRTLRNDTLTPIVAVLTDLGETVPILIVGAVFFVIALLFLKLRWELLVMTAAVLVTWGLNSVLKRLFARERPTVEHLIFADNYSFPSGHAMISSMFYGLLFYLLWRYFKQVKGNVTLARVFAAIGIAWVAFMCLSRIYVGVHFPSDILAGASLGMACWLAAVMAINRISPR